MTDDLRGHLRARLRSAMRKGEPAVGVLRSAIAALDNAEAVEVAEATGQDVDSGAPPLATSPHVAGARSGLGAGETERRILTAQEQRAVLESEIAARRATADDLERRGRPEAAGRLRTDADTLAAALDTAPDTAPSR